MKSFEVFELLGGTSSVCEVLSDPKIAIDWPVGDPILSNKDKEHPTLEAAKKKNLLP